MNAEDILKLISKQWCDLNDLMSLSQVGRNSALKIKQTIIHELKEKGYYVPKNLIPGLSTIFRFSLFKYLVKNFFAKPFVFLAIEFNTFVSIYINV